MLGWDVLVYRTSEKATGETEKVLLAHRQTSVFGIGWIDELVKGNQAIDLGGDGYPCRYSITAGILFPILLKGLPPNNSPAVIGEDYVLPEGWRGKVIFDQQKISECPEEELLLVEVWDQS